MKINLLPFFLGLLLCNASFAQDQAHYKELVQQAFELYQSKEYQQSAETYQKAFDSMDGKAQSRDRYNAACSYALAGDVEQSFRHLFELAESSKTKYYNYDHITTDSDLSNLHSDDRWAKLVAIVKSNKEEAEKYLDKSQVATLQSIRIDYMKNRHMMPQIEAFEEENGKDSEKAKAHRAKIITSDSMNLVKVKEILDERGWLGDKILGDKGSQTLFVVIQHADLDTQVKYLPMLKEAVKQGNASAEWLARLEKSVASKEGK